MITRLIPKIGFGWAIRATGFMMFGLMVIGNVTVKSRIKPHARPFVLRDFVEPLTELPFVFTSLATFFFMLGTFLPFDFIPSHAEYEGMSPYLAGFLLSILNAVRYEFRSLPHCINDAPALTRPLQQYLRSNHSRLRRR
jgi:hypothetical protein